MMMKRALGNFFFKSLAVFALAAALVVPAMAGEMAEVDLGLQSKSAIGQKRLLAVAVKFPGQIPSIPLEKLKYKVEKVFTSYVAEQSYGLAAIIPDFRGYVALPDPLEDYRVSPHNAQVDSGRVRKLIEDTVTALEKDVRFSDYDFMLIIPAVKTGFGDGYGMVCYCANPGMLTPIAKKRKNDPFRAFGREGKVETVRSKNGQEFKGGITVGTDNANVGMFAHDYFHALGGMYGDRRYAPCLYDYKSQSTLTPSPGAIQHSLISIYMGPWDIMSQNFVKPGEPPQGLSSFTKIRLGWIKKDQVISVKPGETRLAALSALSGAGSVHVIKIPVDEDTHYLIENRQPVGFDKILPDSGMLVLEVRRLQSDGTGPVRLKSASDEPGFVKATYKLEDPARNSFHDRKNNIAVLPLWMDGDALNVLVTTPERSGEALRAALSILELKNAGPEKVAALNEAVRFFESFDFEKSLAASKGTSQVGQ